MEPKQETNHGAAQSGGDDRVTQLQDALLLLTQNTNALVGAVSQLVAVVESESAGTEAGNADA